jgi:CHAT domain-containing protein
MHDWRAGLGASRQAQAAGLYLRKRIWDPIQPQIADAKLVLVSPDGALSRLSFGALPGKERGTFLLEERAVAILPSPQALPALIASEPQKSVDGNMLLLGGVDYDSRSTATAATAGPKPFRRRRAPRSQGEALFGALPGSRGEMATIERLYRQNFGSQGITTLDGGRATEEEFRTQAERHLYLHLATHGFFASEQFRSALERSATQRDQEELLTQQSIYGYHPGLLSGVALAGANRPDPDHDDGILTALEVSALDLRGVDLVMLSACETGLGRAAGGEGLLGLQRAFQVAGARSVVASLWKVDDAATRDLMERFYENLWANEMGTLQALREAQLWMLRERGPRGLARVNDKQPQNKRLPPYFWAAFVLSGDWR